ncbi:uncharacterized protein LOC132953573 [Metopolophium dirhodum]|uniref:uncharacterized protein LOC132953573 n=1 Tax=Metopolophium dirhodum TaxID=44670 RepID=UPI00298F8DA9|nr:uncharacterized protein LOC132953573 [Metopolophium dirhodum]
MTALLELMPNIGGPREGIKHLLMSVVHSVMLNSAPTWAPTLMYNRRGVNVLNAIQRRVGIGRVCAYRSVSYEAVKVVAGFIPIDLMALERFTSFEARRAAMKTGTHNGWSLPPGDPEPLSYPQILRA